MCIRALLRQFSIQRNHEWAVNSPAPYSASASQPVPCLSTQSKNKGHGYASPVDVIASNLMHMLALIDHPVDSSYPLFLLLTIVVLGEEKREGLPPKKSILATSPEITSIRDTQPKR